MDDSNGTHPASLPEPHFSDLPVSYLYGLCSLSNGDQQVSVLPAGRLFSGTSRDLVLLLPEQ